MVTYEKEFKEQAVKIAVEVEATRASKDLGISINTLYTWISRSKTHGERAHVGVAETNDRASETMRYLC